MHITKTVTLTVPLRVTARGDQPGAVSLPRGGQVTVALGGPNWGITYQGRVYTAPAAEVFAATG